MMRANPKRLRRVFFKGAFHRKYIFARRDSGAVADAENMRVDGKCLRSERGVHNDIGGFAADTGQSLQRVAVRRNLAIMITHQNF